MYSLNNVADSGASLPGVHVRIDMGHFSEVSHADQKNRPEWDTFHHIRPTTILIFDANGHKWSTGHRTGMNDETSNFGGQEVYKVEVTRG